MRVISSSIRAALIIAALFLGNCFTCPQALIAQTHRCCHKNKQGSTTCRTQALRQFVKADPAPHGAPSMAVVPVETVAPVPALAPALEWTSLPNPAEPAPPDLFSLHSSYRI